MFEHRTKPLLPRHVFYKRMIAYSMYSFGLLVISLIAGMVGYRIFENLSWTDAFLNASMIMGGMGEVNELHCDAAKIFAGIYALYCGLVLLVAVGLLLAPVFHRFMHKFHLELEDKNLK
ncbi:MAG: hypothetical protein HY964_01440 [Ignavibacteriales bacterium]|nr:hypothetical protein [Ignavibacteriales bacterium]